MEELDDLGTYDGDAVHDMWDDYDYEINTGEPGYVDEEQLKIRNWKLEIGNWE